jgi:acyl phosphate:glycerol-3-phosphate acyltransferase
MGTWLWVVISFLCGSLPFAYWIGKTGIRRDIRRYGDGNPGVFNVIRAGGLAWGGFALVLEIAKAAFPVGMAAYILRLEGITLIACAVAAPLGHAFSPFLRFNGGKAIAATAGMWIGLALWIVIFVACALLVFWSLVLKSSAWAVMLTMVCLLAYLIGLQAPLVWLAAWLGTFILLIYKHRRELTRLPRLRFASDRSAQNLSKIEPSEAHG